MFERIRPLILRLMRVPPDPEPPFGAAGSVRIFRAGRNYFKLRLVRWGIGQVGAITGILFSVGLLWKFQEDVDYARAEAARRAAIPVVQSTAPASDQPAPAKPPARKRDRRSGYEQMVQHTPDWVLLSLKLLELGGITLFILQIPVTLAAVRLEFDLHWYIVTDRSLRIRTGLASVQESTMSFANLQQVEVKQGPLQRLLGLADVRVQSAGGGGGGAESGHDHQRHSLHTGIFHGVENAHEIRDLILDRLRQFRQAGLGDPEDQAEASPEVAPAPADALAAAQEVLAEVRALRATVT